MIDPSPAEMRSEAVVPRPRVLVVDDEERVLGVAVRMLDARGFDATGAATGAAALDALQPRGSGFEAVVLDHGLPDTTAIDLLARIRELAPGIPVVLISGNPITLESVPGATSVLRKPFTLDGLTAAVRGALATK